MTAIFFWLVSLPSLPIFVFSEVILNCAQLGIDTLLLLIFFNLTTVYATIGRISGILSATT